MAPKTTNGRRNAHASSPPAASKSTPPSGGPTMQPTPETVPIEAITVPRRSWKRADTRMMHDVSASAPVRPLKK